MVKINGIHWVRISMLLLILFNSNDNFVYEDNIEIEMVSNLCLSKGDRPNIFLFLSRLDKFVKIPL